LQNEQHLRFSLPQLISSDDKVKCLVESLVRYGIVFIDDVAPTPNMTELALAGAPPTATATTMEINFFCTSL